MDDEALAKLDYAYLTTTGRSSGQPREIEIWFALIDGRAYFLAGSRERAHWVRNLLADPQVTLRIGDRSWRGVAGVVTDAAEEARARLALVAKYAPRDGSDLSGWGRTALPVVVERVAELD